MSDLPNPGAGVDDLFALLYEELRTMAHYRLSKSEPITMLDTTSLVHESYVRFVKAGRFSHVDNSQFLAYASHAMRSVVVDLVRRRRTERRGSGEIHVGLEGEEIGQPTADEDDILRVNEALDELAKVDLRLSQVVEMRYFAGLEEREIATALAITERTVRRDWKKARMLLSLALR